MMTEAHPRNFRLPLEYWYAEKRPIFNLSRLENPDACVKNNDRERADVHKSPPRCHSSSVNTMRRCGRNTPQGVNSNVTVVVVVVVVVLRYGVRFDLSDDIRQNHRNTALKLPIIIEHIVAASQRQRYQNWIVCHAKRTATNITLHDENLMVRYRLTAFIWVIANLPPSCDQSCLVSRKQV